MKILYITYFIAGMLFESAALYLYLDRDMVDLLVLVLALNGFTHPLLIYLFPHLGLGYLLELLFSELLVIVSEALLLEKAISTDRKKAFKASLFMNLLSWQLAPFLVHIAGTI